MSVPFPPSVQMADVATALAEPEKLEQSQSEPMVQDTQDQESFQPVANDKPLVQEAVAGQVDPNLPAENTEPQQLAEPIPQENGVKGAVGDEMSAALLELNNLLPPSAPHLSTNTNDLDPGCFPPKDADISQWMQENPEPAYSLRQRKLSVNPPQPPSPQPDDKRTPRDTPRATPQSKDAKKEKARKSTTGTHAFPCSMCDSRFTREYDLKRHQAYSHDEIERPVCPFCKAVLCRPDGLQRHIRSYCRSAKEADPEAKTTEKPKKLKASVKAARAASRASDLLPSQVPYDGMQESVSVFHVSESRNEQKPFGSASAPVPRGGAGKWPAVERVSDLRSTSALNHDADPSQSVSDQEMSDVEMAEGAGDVLSGPEDEGSPRVRKKGSRPVARLIRPPSPSSADDNQKASGSGGQAPSSASGPRLRCHLCGENFTGLAALQAHGMEHVREGSDRPAPSARPSVPPTAPPSRPVSARVASAARTAASASASAPVSIRPSRQAASSSRKLMEDLSEPESEDDDNASDYGDPPLSVTLKRSIRAGRQLRPIKKPRRYASASPEPSLSASPPPAPTTSASVASASTPKSPKKKAKATKPQTGEEKHPCPQCNKSFIRMHDLKRHQGSVHDETLRIECEGCGRRYARLDSLMRHKDSGCPASGTNKSTKRKESDAAQGEVQGGQDAPAPPQGEMQVEGPAGVQYQFEAQGQQADGQIQQMEVQGQAQVGVHELVQAVVQEVTQALQTQGIQVDATGTQGNPDVGVPVQEKQVVVAVAVEQKDENAMDVN